MKRKKITIGDLATMTGIKVPTIRYYEQIGILPKPDRSEGNQRVYTRSDVERLLFVRRGRELGFGLDDVRRLLTLADRKDLPREDVHAIAARQVAQIEEKIEHLTRLKAELEHMRAHVHDDSTAECHIIEALSGRCDHLDEHACAHVDHDMNDTAGH